MASAFQRTSAGTTEFAVRAGPTAPADPRPPTVPTASAVCAASGTPSASGGCEDQLERGTGDTALTPRLAALRDLVQRMTGTEVDVVDPRELTDSGDRDDGHHRGHRVGRRHGHGDRHRGRSVDADPARGARRNGAQGVTSELTASRTTVETESLAFSAEGSVTTADGRQVSFDVDLEMYRQTVRSTQVRLTAGAGEPEPKDPLALNFGTAPSLTARRAMVDLDGDGVAESLPFVGDGAAYLALDRNGNGVVDDGGELFGPASGNGFAELASYDKNGDGWIDEADPVFAQLRLWGSADGPLQSLAEGGVGAIGLANVASPFRLQAGGQTLGELRASGIWLGENGSVGTVHQVDVVG
jgi:hypothetical protein